MFSFADTQSLQIASSNNSKYQEVLLVASKSEQFANTCNSSNDSSTNLLAIRVVNGKQNWEKNITDMQYMNCSLVDANKDGVDDCLLFSLGRGLSALNAQSGI